MDLGRVSEHESWGTEATAEASFACCCLLVGGESWGGGWAGLATLNLWMGQHVFCDLIKLRTQIILKLRVKLESRV